MVEVNGKLYTNRQNLRYHRIKSKRLRKKKEMMKKYSYEEQMLNAENWIMAQKCCYKNVSWKVSVQNYKNHALKNICKSIKLMDSYINGESDIIFPINKKRVLIRERGKERKICPVSIRKRHLEHVFCDNILTPLTKDYLIYDNGASQKGKGTHFARKRNMKHLIRAVNEYGYENVYVLKFDFKNFFGSISLKSCEDLLNKITLNDEKIVKLSMEIITEYYRGNIENENCKIEKERMIEDLKNGKAKGICLGSQTSQMMAVILPSVLDHIIKDKYGFKYYVRYMDDGVVYHNDKKHLLKLLKELKEEAKNIGLTFNERKTYIQKATKKFTFLKQNYKLKDGYIFVSPHKSASKRLRIKMKKFKHLLDKNEILTEDVYTSFSCAFLNIVSMPRSYTTYSSLLNLYKRLFDDYKIEEIETHIKNIKDRNTKKGGININEHCVLQGN